MKHMHQGVWKTYNSTYNPTSTWAKLKLTPISELGIFFEIEVEGGVANCTNGPIPKEIKPFGINPTSGHGTSRAPVMAIVAAIVVVACGGANVTPGTKIKFWGP